MPLRWPLRRCGASPRLQTAAVRTEPARQAFLADAAVTELSSGGGGGRVTMKAVLSEEEVEPPLPERCCFIGQENTL